MPDLSMPQRQTYPNIKGRVEDEVGALPLQNADLINLLLEVDTESDLFLLAAEWIDPEDDDSIFMLGGQEFRANFVATIGSSGVSTDVSELRGKLEIIWDATTTPPLRQFCPGDDGFITVVITENVQASS